MKKLFLIGLALMILGCSYGGDKIQGYLDEPRTLFEDPVSVEHQQALDDLERVYLRKEITYAQYLEKKKRLEEDYVRDIRGRETMIGDNR